MRGVVYPKTTTTKLFKLFISVDTGRSSSMNSGVRLLSLSTSYLQLTSELLDVQEESFLPLRVPGV